MKLYLIISILTASIFSDLFPQDRIITLNNDTIKCLITKTLGRDIQFDINTGVVSTTRKIQKKNVLSYIISGSNVQLEKNFKLQVPYLPIYLTLSSGPGYLVASSENAETAMIDQGFSAAAAKAYYADMRLGIYISADAVWVNQKEFGAGVKYKFFTTSAKTEGYLDPQDGVYLIYGFYKEQIYVNFIAATFRYQKSINSRNSLMMNTNCSAGLSLYRNEAEYAKTFYLLTGKNFGFDTNIGLEYLITTRMSACCDLSVFYSNIRRMDISDGVNSTTVKLSKDNSENLTRIDFSLGVRIYLWKR
ncbi:MAG: hypothetical protein WCE64_15290 [Bacteroidales bacterium]